MPDEKMVDSSSDQRTVNNTFRSQYRVLTDTEKHLMDSIKDQAQSLLETFHHVGPSREVSLAITNLEQAVMWAVKGLTK